MRYDILLLHSTITTSIRQFIIKLSNDWEYSYSPFYLLYKCGKNKLLSFNQLYFNPSFKWWNSTKAEQNILFDFSADLSLVYHY